MKNIFYYRSLAVSLAVLLALSGSAPLAAASTDTVQVESSTETVTEPPAPEGEETEPLISTGTLTSRDDVNAALSDMNYKIEVIQERYLRLNKDIDELRLADRDQRRILNEQILLQVDPRSIASLQAEVALVRADLAQAREDLSLLKNSVEERRPGREKTDLLHSPWLSVGALGLSLIALLAR
ncbi:MAG: hypothetical protein ACYC5N_11950 [Endomicrobiales bacterium]